MKVSNSNVSNSAALGVNQSQQAEAAGQSSRSKPGGSSESSGADRVHMSSIAGVVGSESSSRAERVSQLADAVQSGRYRVDAKAVSHAIVNASMDGVE
jgi:anti-sigma28 factor (negative regulator of flagellin synthesis)